ncbi:unnamed protein product [Schistosoma curassoni]|uniref:Solute carrier family 66 member 3 n=1 Tax=Schistosoma curassoni TaxID=6186 RepID=A0A183K975_9TREM|nr:unnamed protein product [Schistosoma curassoni]
MALEDLISPIISKECFYKFTKEDLFDGPCFKATISKLLGYGIVIGSSLVKIPQVIKVAKCKNSFGLSILSILLEMISLTSVSAYSFANGFPFSAYGEGVFLGIQNFLLAIMAITWTYSHIKAVLFSCAYIACVAVLLSPTLPLSILILFQTVNLPIMLSSKNSSMIPKVEILFSRSSNVGKDTFRTEFCGLIKLTMLAYDLANGSRTSSTARIFTSIQETGDNLMIISCILASLCNYILMGQLVYYWNVSSVSKIDQQQQQQQYSTRKVKVN